MTPFYGCVSFGPVLDGRCGNCLWHEQRCTFEGITAGDTSGDPATAGKAKFQINQAPVSVSLARFAKGEEVVANLDEIVAEQRKFIESRLKWR